MLKTRTSPALFTDMPIINQLTRKLRRTADACDHVPLGEMFGYSTGLRSMSQGRAVYAMQFRRYKEVPGASAEVVASGAMARAS